MTAPDPLLLAQQIIRQCTTAGWTLAAAESITGGAFLSLLTGVPGASRVVLGGAVVYSASAKRLLADVPEDRLALQGTVAAETSRLLAQGIRQRLDATIGLAVTGNAGPSAEGAAPVGRVYWALVSDADTVEERFDFPGGRQAVREHAVAAGLALLSAWIEGRHPA